MTSIFSFRFFVAKILKILYAYKKPIVESEIYNITRSRPMRNEKAENLLLKYMQMSKKDFGGCVNIASELGCKELPSMPHGFSLLPVP